MNKTFQPIYVTIRNYLSCDVVIIAEKNIQISGATYLPECPHHQTTLGLTFPMFFHGPFWCPNTDFFFSTPFHDDFLTQAPFMKYSIKDHQQQIKRYCKQHPNISTSVYYLNFQLFQFQEPVLFILILGQSMERSPVFSKLQGLQNFMCSLFTQGRKPPMERYQNIML